MNQDTCSICLEIEEGNYIQPWTCIHSFHQNCINTWLSRNGTCPFCRCSDLRIHNQTNGYRRNEIVNLDLEYLKNLPEINNENCYQEQWNDVFCLNQKHSLFFRRNIAGGVIGVCQTCTSCQLFNFIN